MGILESIFGPLGVRFWLKSKFLATGNLFLVCGSSIWGLVVGFFLKKANIFFLPAKITNKDILNLDVP